MTAAEVKIGDAAPQKVAGKAKWKNKIKNFLTSPLPSSKPVVASLSRASNESYGETQTYGNDVLVQESYEARLSKLVGDLEDADYGSAFRSFGGLDSPRPFSALTPTNFSDLQAGISVEDALSAYTAFGDYSFSDIIVPTLEEAPTPAASASAPLSATQSSASTASAQSKGTAASRDAAFDRPSAVPVCAPGSALAPSPLFPGDVLGVAVPFNSPADGPNLHEAGIMSLSMPFSFDDLKGMGLIEGGGLDIGGGGGKDDDEFADLLRLSQIGGPEDESRDSCLGMGSFNLNLFPMPGFVPSPVTDASGPSPALSYGESSGTSNTSFEELGLDPNGTLRPIADSKGLSSGTTLPSKAFSHAPRASITSIPPTPTSYASASSAPTTPHRPRPLPRVHASALQWRVAPTMMSPKSSIMVSPGRPMTKSPSFVGNEAHGSPSRLGRINTASSPELKRRRESEDVGPRSIDAMLASPVTVVHGNTQGASRPIAGRRRVAGEMIAPPMRHSQSQHQLYQAPTPLAQMPQLPSYAGGWMAPQLVQNLYTQLNSHSFLCSLQGCHRTFSSGAEVEAHVQHHFAAAQSHIQPYQPQVRV